MEHTEHPAAPSSPPRPWATGLPAGTVIAALFLGIGTGWLMPALSPLFLLGFLYFAPTRGGLLRKLAAEWHFPGRFWGDSFLVALLATLATAAVTAAWLKVLYAVTGTEPDPMQEIARLFLASSPGMKLFLAWNILIAAPILEELIFRRLLFDLCGRFLPQWGAFLLTALLFAAAHRHLPSFPGLCLLGVILQAFYVWTRNLATAVMIHVFFNGIALAGLLWNA